MYLRVFDAAGISIEKTYEMSDRIAGVISDWDSKYLEEIHGVASGAGVEPWHVTALNARTEILSQSTHTGGGECSTLAYIPRYTELTAPELATPVGIQTWDWHQELDAYWHTQSVRGTKSSFVGLSEHGILGKIGINSNGLGVLINILGHRDDAPTGIPVHILAAAVLGTAGSVDEALELLRSAPIGTSSALTLLDSTTAVCAELSPLGVAAVTSQNGFLPHTNHFLDTKSAVREKTELYEPDTHGRFNLLTSRVRRYAKPASPENLVEYLYSDTDQPHLSCYPDPEAKFGARWKTLATIILDPVNRNARILDGTPIESRQKQWLTLTADADADADAEGNQRSI